MGFPLNPLKVKLLAGKQKATEQNKYLYKWSFYTLPGLRRSLAGNRAVPEGDAYAPRSLAESAANERFNRRSQS